MLVLAAAAPADGLIAAKASPIVIAVGALLGLIGIGLMTWRLFPPWTDPRHRPIVVGVMFIAIAAVGLGVSFVIRYHS